jgi:hypothetical protein
MPHDFRNPKGIFTAAQGIGCETVPGLFHFPVVKTDFFQGRFPYTLPQMAGIDHGSGWRTEKEFFLSSALSQQPGLKASDAVCRWRFVRGAREK